MLFDEPIPFAEALNSRKVKALLPTELSSGELARIRPDILERAMFSARTMNAGYLQKMADVVKDLLNPRTEIRDGKPFTAGIDPATARLRLKQALGEINYTPTPDDEGTLKDLSSDRRLNLVLKMNVEMAQGYGQFEQGQDEDALDAFPAQELFRAEGREKPRDWYEIWTEAGGDIFDGRMIALKNDPIWEEISDFGIPYPPFKYNSGMWVRDVDRDTAVELGLIDRDTQITPQDRGLNDDLKFTPDIRSGALVQALVGEGYKFLNGVLTAG